MGLLDARLVVGGGVVTEMKMVRMPKQELDEGTHGWICNRSKPSLECLLIKGVRFINKLVEGC